MFVRFILLVVCSVSFLRSFHVSSCNENCADKPVFTPSRLVVKYGGSTSASCSVCQHCQGRTFDLEVAVGRKEKNGSMISWMVDKLTEWDTSPICYYKDGQCCSSLRITVYQPPDTVSISVVNHTGTMLEGSQYTLQCSVQNVAPVENLYVTFYRGQTQLGQPQSNSNTEKKPKSEIFTLNFIPSNEDDEGQLWCEAKLELGPEGPRPPPVVKSQSINATVHYKPQLEGSSHPDPITITEGDSLQLNCSAVANPRPSYTWTSPSPTAPSSRDSVFTIKSVTSADIGQYTCSVSNYLGTTTVEFNVTAEVTNPTTVTSPTTVTNPTTVTSPTTVTNPTTVTSPTTVATTTERNRSSSSVLIHRFILCFTLLFSVLV